jgi:bacterioferritin-associated ferredoxin
MSIRCPDRCAGTPPRLVCRCLGVSSLRIAGAIEQQGLTSLDQVMRCTRAGTGCGACHPEIEEILGDLTGKPVPAACARDNRLAFREATQVRVEDAVYRGIAPRLAPQTDVQLIAVEGLRVDLHLRGHDGADLQQRIRELLRKLVCADLEVAFG